MCIIAFVAGADDMLAASTISSLGKCDVEDKRAAHSHHLDDSCLCGSSSFFPYLPALDLTYVLVRDMEALRCVFWQQHKRIDATRQ